MNNKRRLKDELDLPPEFCLSPTPIKQGDVEDTTHQWVPEDVVAYRMRRCEVDAMVKATLVTLAVVATILFVMFLTLGGVCIK